MVKIKKGCGEYCIHFQVTKYLNSPSVSNLLICTYHRKGEEYRKLTNNLSTKNFLHNCHFISEILNEK